MTVVYTNWTQSLQEPQTRGRLLHADNVLAGGTISSFGRDTSTDELAPAGWETYEKFKVADGEASGGWGLTFPTDQTIGCLAVAGHNFGSTGSLFRLDTWNGSSWSIEYPYQAADNDSPIMWFFNDTTARGFRLTVSTGTAPPKFAVVRFGTPLVFPRPVFANMQVPGLSRNTTHRARISDTGETFPRVVQRSSLSGEFTVQHIPPAWLSNNWYEAQLALEKAPFFLAWRPDGSKTTRMYAEVAFGGVTQTPRPETMGVRDYWKLNLSWRGPAYE